MVGNKESAAGHRNGIQIIESIKYVHYYNQGPDLYAFIGFIGFIGPNIQNGNKNQNGCIYVFNGKIEG